MESDYWPLWICQILLTHHGGQPRKWSAARAALHVMSLCLRLCSQHSLCLRRWPQIQKLQQLLDPWNLIDCPDDLPSVLMICFRPCYLRHFIGHLLSSLAKADLHHEETSGYIWNLFLWKASLWFVCSLEQRFLKLLSGCLEHEGAPTLSIPLHLHTAQL